MSAHVNPDAEAFFDFEDQQPDPASGRAGWLIVLVVLAGLVVALVFTVASMLAFEKAGRYAQWADHSFVVTGSYQTMTHDLVTKNFNGIYAGHMPDRELVHGHRFDNGLNDPAEVRPGQQITFRGVQTGVQDADFPDAVDAVIALQGDTLEVVDTDEPGSYGEGITAGSVTAQRVKAAGLAALALVSVAATVWGALRIHRRAHGR